MRGRGLGALLILTGCSGGEPESLPVFEDTGMHRECACVTQGRCVALELAEGDGEERRFQCRWEDRAAGRAACSYESRFKPKGGIWSEWEKSAVPFRLLGDKGWCWTRRSLADGPGW